MNKDKIKNELLSIEQVHFIVEQLGGEPMDIDDESFVSRTICHNGPHDGNYHLYYYHNTHGFVCYSSCGYLDIFELVCLVKDVSLYKAIQYVCNAVGITMETEDEFQLHDESWDILNKLKKKNQEKIVKKKAEIKKYDASILTHLPHPRIAVWEEEGISPQVMQRYGICYHPINEAIIIPHYDVNGNLVGIRERTLIKENEKYGKYRPSVISGIMYNHALGFHLYGLNEHKDYIKQWKTAIIFESEKSVLQAESFNQYLGVACCGSSLSQHQANLLKELGVETIVIAFDKQFHEASYKDEEWSKWTQKMYKLNDKFSAYFNVEFMFDKWNLLGYKDSPTDRGEEIYKELWDKRFALTN